MKRLLPIAAGALLLSLPIQALPAPAATAEKAAQEWCAAYQAPGTLEQVAEQALGVRLSGFHSPELRSLLERSFYNYSTRANQCASNLKNAGMAVEIFRTEHSGQLPKSLAELAPDIVERLPVCPAAGVDSYSASYKVGADGKEYSLFCSGDHHAQAGIASDQPSLDGASGIVQGIPLRQPARRTCSVTSLTHTENDPGVAFAVLEETTAANLDGAPSAHSARLVLVEQPVGWVVADVRLSEQQEEARKALMGSYLIEYWGMPAPKALGEVVGSAMQSYAKAPPLEQMALMARLSKEPVANLLDDDFSLAYTFQGDIHELRRLATAAVVYYRENQGWPPAGALVNLNDPDERKIALTPDESGQKLEIALTDSGYRDFKIPVGYPRVVVDTEGRFRFVYRP